jgi:hypothetical protein
MESIVRLLDATLDAQGDILRLHAAFVARTFYPGLGRLGLADLSAGARGWYCERWIASSVQADNADFLEGEGMGRAELTDGSLLPLARALALRGGRLLGEAYARRHGGRFGVLAKVLDIGAPIPWHVHAREEDARRFWNSRGKEEAYFFLETDNAGPLPYSHLGVHPDVTSADLLPVLQRWEDDSVLDFSPAYRLNTRRGFHVPPGVPHAPGTALTLELQEESDVYNFLQAVSGGRRLDRSLLLRGLPDEAAVLRLVNWETARRTDFYRVFRTQPTPCLEAPGAREMWVFHPRRTSKFSGKEARIEPGAAYTARENGPYALLAWRGHGEVNRVPFAAGQHTRDELFVGARTATEPHALRNTGDEELVLYKVFGPDVN